MSEEAMQKNALHSKTCRELGAQVVSERTASA